MRRGPVARLLPGRRPARRAEVSSYAALAPESTTALPHYGGQVDVPASVKRRFVLRQAGAECRYELLRPQRGTGCCWVLVLSGVRVTRHDRGQGWSAMT